MNIRPCTVGAGEYPTVRGGPFPFTVEATVTSNFGPRERISTAVGTTGPFHYGTDFYADPPPALLAISDGRVLIAEANHPEVGNWIRVDAGDGWAWDYYHMAYVPIVIAGDVIRAGDLVGIVGSTGIATGPHLHLGIAHDGINLDPLAMLRRCDPVPLAGGEFYPEQEDGMEPVKVVNAEAIAAVKAAVTAVGQQDGDYLATAGSGRVAFDVPAGKRAIIAVVKED